MARKPLRVTLGVLGGLVGLLLVAAILLPLLVPRERLRQIAEDQARQYTGGEISLGEVSLKVLPRLRLVLGASTAAVTGDGLRGAGQDPGPLLDGEASLKRLEVDLALMPLLQRRLEFGEVKLVEPRLNLVTMPPAEVDAAESGDPGAPVATGEAAGVGLALAAVAVRDGEVTWIEDGTGRQVTVTGWDQDLTAPALGAIMQRLQRLGGVAMPADEHHGDASLDLDTRVAAVTFTGFTAQPAPVLADLHLRGRLSLPPAADQATVTIDELSLAGLSLSARAAWTSTRLTMEELALQVADAGRLEGRGFVNLEPAAGPLELNLSGFIDLAGVMVLAEPWLPPSEDAPALPELAGGAEVDLEARLAVAPPLSDVAAWQSAWDAGLDGRVQARLTVATLTVNAAQVPDALTVNELAVVSDLSSAHGRTRLSVGELTHPAARGQLSAEFALPPASGALQVEGRFGADLAALLATAEAVMPPRPEDAEPLPVLSGAVDLTLDIDLPDAPSLADTLAWRTAWEGGLRGRAQVEARGSNLTVATEALGADPLAVATMNVVSDLRSPGSTSEVKLTGMRHAVLSGDGRLTVRPVGPAGVPDLTLHLDRLDLDAVVAINEARREAVGDQARAWNPVATAWADTSMPPAVGDLIPADLALDFVATAAILRLQKLDYRQIDLAGTLRERVIAVPAMSARLGDGRILGSAEVDYASDPYGQVEWQAEAVQVPASALLAPYAGKLAQAWTGALSATLGGSCSLMDADVIKQTLTVTGDLVGTDGQVNLTGSLGDVSRFLGDRQDLLRVGYNQIRQHLDVRDGRVHLENLAVDGHETDWTGNGWLGLDGTIDLGLSVKLPAGYTPSLGDLSFLAEGLRGDDGRVQLDLKLTGQSRKPTVGLDLDPAAMLQKKGLQEGLEDEVKKGLGGLLDRLKGK